MEAGTATGWQATDWLEDIMLRTAGIDKYQQWITHDLKFNSPEVKTAMEDAAKIFFTDKYVNGTSGTPWLLSALNWRGISSSRAIM